jgi:hypothetical protein
MLPQAINFKAAALTAYLSTLGFTKRIMWSFLVFDSQRTLPTALDFDLHAVPPRLKEMLLGEPTLHASLL